MYVVYLFTNPAILNYDYFAFGSYSLWKFLEFSESKKAYYQIWAWRKPRISHAEFRVIWNWCVWKFLVENSTWKNDISVFRQKMTRKDPTWEKPTVFGQMAVFGRTTISNRWPFSDETSSSLDKNDQISAKFRKIIFRWPFNWFGMKPINFRINSYVIINLNFNTKLLFILL